MFFHTDLEASPSITYDLIKSASFSSLTVENSPNYPERAVPLAAEVSSDGVAFREIARIEQVFKLWEPHFRPQTARYLRLRAMKQTWLHLRRIEAHP